MICVYVLLCKSLILYYLYRKYINRDGQVVSLVVNDLWSPTALNTGKFVPCLDSVYVDLDQDDLENINVLDFGVKLDSCGVGLGFLLDSPVVEGMLAGEALGVSLDNCVVGLESLAVNPVVGGRWVNGFTFYSFRSWDYGLSGGGGWFV